MNLLSNFLKEPGTLFIPPLLSSAVMRNKNVLYIATLAALVLVHLSGCGSMDSTTPNISRDPSGLTLELYLSRSSAMNPVDFEQYSLRNGKMFQECGKIKREKTFTEEQELVKLDQDQITILANAAGVLTQTIEATNPTFEKPATKDRFFDPGKTILKIELENKRYEVETSLDSIGSPTSKHEKDLLSLVKEVRNTSKTTCGNSSFYGVSNS